MIASMLRAGAVLALPFLAAGSAQAFELKAPPKIAFIYATTVKDGGWNEAIDQGREALADELHTKIAVAENIPEDATSLRNAIDLYVKRGYNIIVGTTYGYSEAMAEAAKAYPDVAFFNASGVNNSDNMESFYARTYQAWYLAGMAAGDMSKTGKVGILAGFPVGVVNWDLNGFARGVQAAKPDAQTIAVFTNSWWDPVKEGQVAEAILDQGADELATNLSAASALNAAEKRPAGAIGYQLDMSAAAPKQIITSVVFHWDKYLVPRIKEVIAGTWKPEPYGWFEGLSSGVVGLAPWGPNVPESTKEKVAAAEKQIIDGDLKVYAGPVLRQDGTEVVPAGKVLPEEDLWTMDYFVKGVIGTMPKTQ
ncbi:BMP family ABC transporter substrate-binding protein [Pseudooceanicola sp. CBS1P-1]|uniref:BMP family ABC transporter substrate-binding protein n=1 Tax=Pseudooceanicola albus TaxID=2692189 RepID=A0A6L7G622_9RHOB|nr:MULTISPECIES: BMP family ABC transporter substrate-binding protein [Pseudooceanicola]MBT9386014.1 BMP family ABC transporter substrate-binding protein [Pseudooceanicola endophyticus]MXN19565.1 BMP family ABC transporter substrate-binding protein [Pseudooceanicola albus]